MQSDFLLISAPTKAGEAFMKLVGLPFIALTNNKMERNKLEGQRDIYSKNGDVKFLLSSLKANKNIGSV